MPSWRVVRAVGVSAQVIRGAFLVPISDQALYFRTLECEMNFAAEVLESGGTIGPDELWEMRAHRHCGHRTEIGSVR